MWSLVKPGGGILIYDFVYNNPRNKDVIAIPIKEIRALFPRGSITTSRLTLAPPINRFVSRLHGNLYSIFNACPLLRTHVLSWITKV
jgi:hypothetical protein